MLEELLPLRATTIRLRFRRQTWGPFFHQPLLRPFLKELLADKKALDDEPGLWVDAVNSGHIRFQAGDEYRFHLFCLQRARPLFTRLLDALRRLPRSYPGRRERAGLLGDNMEFLGLLDYFTGQPVKREAELFGYDRQALQREWDFWRRQPELCLRFTSPARLKRRKTQRGVPPYIDGRGQLHPGETERRAYRSLCHLNPAIAGACDETAISYRQVEDRLFWTDNAKTLDDGRLAPFGGVLGDIILADSIGADNPHLPLLILGQYTGIGERRGYGLGRYRLETPAGEGTTPPITIAPTHRDRSATIANFELACANLTRKHPDLRRYIDGCEALDLDRELADENVLGLVDLHDLCRRLREGSYQAQVLQGAILRRPGHHPRPLAIPSLEERIVQRAVVEVLAPVIDRLATDRSYGYRHGHSRQQARDRILTLNRQGYRWYFEADIVEFFDLLDHREIRNRLESFFPDEPLVLLLMAWISAPLRFEGRLIERTAGLPQGAPISPMLANLMLEDLDADLEARGMQLVRFADDFIVLCKTREQAQEAAEQARQSLAELGLKFNPVKTDIGQFSHGFEFLGYTFVNDMAVESPRPRHPPGKLRLENIPAASWLTRLLDEEPQLLEELNTRMDRKSPLVLSSQTARREELPPSEQGATLLVTPPEKYVHQSDGALEVVDARTREILTRQNWNDLAAIVLYGRHQISLRCQLSAMDNGVPIHFCSATGKYLGVSCHQRPSREGAELWLLQTRHFAPESAHRLPLCRALVGARIHNQIEMLRQRLRHDSGEGDPLPALQALLDRVPEASEETLRGFEGQATNLYYQCLSVWVPEAFGFQRRNRRPPRDPFNALLSLGYSMLYSHAATVLQVAGLFVWQGFYHRRRDRHMALASDLVEPYRHLVERTALTLVRSGQLKPADFHYPQNGACLLTRQALRLYLRHLQQRMLKPVLAKQAEESRTAQQHMLHTAHQLIRYLRNSEQEVHFFRLR